MNATIYRIKKLDFGFWAKGFTRQNGQKNDILQKKWKALKLSTYHRWWICNHFGLETCIWKRIFLYQFDPEHQKLMWCDKAKNETGSVRRLATTLGTSFAFFILCILLGKHLFQELRKAIDFNKGLFSIPSKSFFFFSFVYLSHYRNRILFFLLFYGTTLHISFFFLLPFSFLESCISSNCSSAAVFCSIRDGYILFKHIINAIPSSKKRSIIPKQHWGGRKRRSTSTKILSSVSSLFAVVCTVYRSSNREKYSIFCHINNICFVT